MNYGLAGKTVVVTGGSKGIGYAAAETFLREGAEVWFNARSGQEVSDAESKLSHLGIVHGVVMDGTDEDAVYRLADMAAEKDGTISAWVNNIGTNKQRAGVNYTEAELDYLIAANFKTTVFGTQAAFKYMKKNGGSIINIASLAARAATTGRSTIYAAMKAAVVQYSRIVAGEFGAYGVRVNAILPGYTRTPLTDVSFTREALDQILTNNLIGRMAKPQEIADAIVFLASERASYITGTSLEVSGGQLVVINPEYGPEMKAKEEGQQ